MMHSLLKLVLRVLLTLVCGVPALVYADPVRVFVAGAAKAGFDAVSKDLADPGDSLDVVYDTAGALRDRVLMQGQRPDLVILSNSALDSLAERGLIRPGDRNNLGSVVAGVAVRQGAPVPDISTPDRLRRALMAASSIGCADAAHGATSGAHFERVIERMGIRDEIQLKLQRAPTGTDVLAGVASGQFELGISQSSEIQGVRGVTFVGGLPKPFELRTTYAMAALGGSEKGRHLLLRLGSAMSRAAFEASGLSQP
jgi:molybdate transport system substrate-binding protein